MAHSGPRVARLAALGALSPFAIGLFPSSAAAKTHDKGTLKLTLTAASGGADAGAAGDGTESACTFGTFSAANPPGPCWRPYAATSPFNTPVPSNAPVVSNSAALVANLNGGPGWRTFGDPDRRPSSPNFYWSNTPDPPACWHAFGASGQPVGYANSVGTRNRTIGSAIEFTHPARSSLPSVISTTAVARCWCATERGAGAARSACTTGAGNSFSQAFDHGGELTTWSWAVAATTMLTAIIVIGKAGPDRLSNRRHYA